MKSDIKSLVLIAGELSGDRYGAQLAQCLKSQHPDIKLAAIGGPQLAAVVDVFIDDIATKNWIGPTEGLNGKKRLELAFQKLEQHLKQTPPDHTIIIDFPNGYLKASSICQSFKLPITTFITPNFWIWKDKKKAKAIAQYSRNIVTIYEREFDFYSQFSPNVHYFGHPLINNLSTDPVNNRPYLAIFPGSRKQEISATYPVILESLKTYSGTLIPKLMVASDDFHPLLESIEKKCSVSAISRWEKSGPELLQESPLVITATGTTSLEAILCDAVPIVLGRLSTLSYVIAKLLLNISMPFVALPNIIANKKIVPEWIQNKLNAKNLTASLKELGTSEQRQKILDQFGPYKQRLIKNGNSYQKTAALVLKNNPEKQ